MGRPQEWRTCETPTAAPGKSGLLHGCVAFASRFISCGPGREMLAKHVGGMLAGLNLRFPLSARTQIRAFFLLTPTLRPTRSLRRRTEPSRHSRADREFRARELSLPVGVALAPLRLRWHLSVSESARLLRAWTSIPPRGPFIFMGRIDFARPGGRLLALTDVCGD
jgi:hypothetical protein